MSKPRKKARAGNAQERKYRRFSLKYPVHVKFHSGKAVCEVDGLSRNVSIGGLLLETATLIPQHSAVSFVMTLQGGPLVRPIALASEAKVVRVEPAGADTGFVIALKCKRPITGIASYLSAAP